MNRNRIIFPTDLSKESRNALQYTYAFSRAYEMELSILHVYKPKPFLSKEGWIPRRQKSRAWNRLTKFAQIGQEGCIPPGISLMLKKGEVEKQIVAASKTEGCRFIAMGKKHAYSAFRKMIGTKTAGVMAKANCPVMVIPAHFKFRPIQNILIVGGEYRKLNPVVQSCILRMSLRFNADLHYIDMEENENPTWGLQKELLHNSNFLIQKSVPAEFIYDVLPEYIQKHQMDLIVMMTRRQAIFEELFKRSFEQNALHLVDVPLLVFHSNYLYQREKEEKRKGQQDKKRQRHVPLWTFSSTT